MYSLVDTTKYNEEPVLYCKHCLSLKILGIPTVGGMDYCDDCGCTDIEECNIHDWEDMYINKYGIKFLDR